MSGEIKTKYCTNKPNKQINITVRFFRYAFERSNHLSRWDNRREMRKNRPNDPSKNTNVGSVQVATIISPANTESSLKVKNSFVGLNEILGSLTQTTNR